MIILNNMSRDIVIIQHLITNCKGLFSPCTLEGGKEISGQYPGVSKEKIRQEAMRGRGGGLPEVYL